MTDKILIVDDDRELREELRDVLHDYEVIEAMNGEEALKILRRANEIGLVVLDVVMPGAGGIDTLEQIKKMDPELNIIILTGHSSKDVAIDALKAHADDYIEKPAQIKRLTDAVGKLLGEPSRRETDISLLSLDEKVGKVKKFVERNRFRKVTLKEAADSVCLSPKYLSKIFSDYSREGFTDYKLKVKIAAAKELLKKAGYNINQISYKLGYENTESFVRQFKKIVGQTPTEYRCNARPKK